MATQKTTVVVDVVDNGSTEKLNQQAQKTHKSFKDLAKTAGNIVVGGAKQALSLAKGPPQQSGFSSIMSETEYGAARGAAGLTGASARDFAKQAEGLSGLVRLYAVYAANIYAAGAAFTALSKAMDTANMVKGLDQLGAASGVALGSLSKRLVDATDGAVALRDAMEATVKASSSGMNSEQILRMGKAAKLASQALGVDMNDALSRITRGITKLEPELLDELGIFIKVDDVVTKYAQSVGRSASAITDFEKRQAIANAVLTQAEEKFSAIDIDTNPYTQLAAVMRDLSQTGLELVNKALGPIARYLAESPNTLTVALAGLVGLIVRQAIPALAEYRQSVLLATQEAAKANAERYTSAKKYLALEAATLKAQADAAAEAAHDKFEASSKIIVDNYKNAVNSAGKMGAKIAEIVKKDIDDITEAERAYIAQAAKRPTAISATYKTILKEIEDYHNNAAQSMAASSRINEEYAQKEANATAEYTARNKKNVQDMFSSNIRAQAAYIASTKGWAAAIQHISDKYTELRTGAARVAIEIEEFDANGKKVTKTITEQVPAMSKIGATMAGLGAAASATLSKITGFLGGLGRIAEVVGIVIAVGGLLYSWISNTGKQSAETSKSLDVLDSSLTNIAKTVEVINNKPAQLQFNVQSLSAAANAVADLGTQITDVFEKSYKEIEAMNWADKIADAIMPGSVQGRLVENTAKSIEAVFSAVDENSPAAKAAKSRIQSILELDPKAALSAEDLEKALNKLSDSAKKNAIDSISKAIKTLGTEMQIAAAKGTELLAAFAKVDEQRKKVALSFVPKDEFSQYGQDLVDASLKLGAALSDPVQKYNALIELAKEYPKIAGANEGVAISLQNIASDVASLNNVNARYNSLQQSSAKVEKDLISLIGDRTVALKLASGELSPNKWAGPAVVRKQIQGLINDFQTLAKESKISSDLSVNIKLRIDQAQAAVTEAQLDVFKHGAAVVSQSLSAEWAKAGTTITNAYASILSGTEAGIRLRAEAEKRVINAQIEQIKSQRELIISNQRLAISIEREAIARWKATADSKDFPAIRPREEALDIREKQLNEAASGKAIQGMYSKLTQELTAGGRTLTELDNASLNFARNLEASAAAMENLRAQAKAVDISKEDQLLMRSFELRQQNLKSEQEMLKAQRDSLSITKQTLGGNSVQQLQQEQLLDAKDRELAQDAARLAIEAKILRLKQPGVLSQPGVQEEIAREKANLANLTINQSIDDVTFNIKQKHDLIRRTVEAENDARRRAKEAADIQAQALQSQLDIQYTLLELGRESTAIKSDEYLNQKNILDVQKAQLEADKRRREISEGTTSKLVPLQQQESELYAAGSERNLTEEEVQALIRIREEREKILQNQKDGLNYTNLILQANLQSLAIQKELGLVQEAWGIKLKELQGFAETLKGIFGEVGDRFVDGMLKVGSALADNALRTKENELAIKGFGDKAAEAFAKAEAAPDIAGFEKYMAEGNALLKEQAKAETKKTKDEISGYAKTAAAAKSMFKEKTAAHKVLAATEKALHIARIAMDIKEMFFDTTKTGAAVANSATRTGASVVEAGVDAVKAVIKAISDLPFPLNIAAGAATAAVVGSLLSQIGGSGPNVSGVGAAISSEQRQETQGTAMGYNEKGEKVQVRRGVFGDTDAKSESIANSLESIKDVAVEGLSYDNKVVALLESIDRGINNTAKSLYRVEGLRTGSMFGTVEGTSGKGLGGLSLGGKTTKEIIDSGIILKGAFADLASDVNKSAIDLFETVKKTKKSWYGSSRTSTYTQLKEIDDNISNFFTDIYSNATKLFVEVGSSAGVSQDAVNAALKNLKIDETISFRGLKGEDLEKELESVIGATLDDAAYAIFSSFDKFAEFGEGMLETVIRVTDSNKKVLQVLENQALPDFENLLATTGVKVQKIAEEATYGVSPELLKAASTGLSAFLKTPVRDAFKEIRTILGDAATDALDSNLNNLSNSQLETLKNAGASFVTTLTEEVYKEVLSFDTADIKQRSYEITEALVDLAGGLQEFVDRANFYTEEFMTDAERIAPTIGAVSEELGRLGGLGYTSADGLVDTREEFTALVSSLDVTTEAGQNAYTALMALAPGFDAILDPIEALQATTRSLNIDLLTELGRTVEATAMEYADATKEMTSAEKAIYDYNLALQRQIDAIVAAKKILAERAGLEQKLYQLTDNTTALRSIELSNIDASNRALQIMVWGIEDLTKSLNEAKSAVDAAKQRVAAAESKIASIRTSATDNYVSATQRVADAQKAIADLAIEAAKKMRDFGKALREFIEEELLPKDSRNSLSEFATTIQAALRGDTSAIQNVPEVARQAIDTAKETANSSEAFNALRASILSQVGIVASFAESQAALANIPEEEDPLVTANKALEAALREQTEALRVANTIGASLIKAPDDLITQFREAKSELASAISAQKTAEEDQRKAQAALDALVAAATKALELNAEALKLSFIASERLSAIDTNLDGKLTYDELVAGLKDRASEEVIKTLMTFADFNADNMIDSYELAVFNGTKSVTDTLDINFEQLASSLDGKLTEETFTTAISAKASDAKLEDLIATVSSGNASILGALYAIDSWASDIASNTGSFASALDSIAASAAAAADAAASAASSAASAAVSATTTASTLTGTTTVAAFATGGVFSNSIVSRPTNFDFGIMGEAGPEAIMPLTRTSGGRLGVVAKTQPVDGLTGELATQNAALLQELRQLKDAVELLRYEAQATASHTNKTTRILQRVTQDGETLLVTNTTA